MLRPQCSASNCREIGAFINSARAVENARTKRPIRFCWPDPYRSAQAARERSCYMQALIGLLRHADGEAMPLSACAVEAFPSPQALTAALERAAGRTSPIQ